MQYCIKYLALNKPGINTLGLLSLQSLETQGKIKLQLEITKINMTVIVCWITDVCTWNREQAKLKKCYETSVTTIQLKWKLPANNEMDTWKSFTFPKYYKGVCNLIMSESSYIQMYYCMHTSMHLFTHELHFHHSQMCPVKLVLKVMCN